MCDVDLGDDYCTVYRETRLTARAAHKCCSCGAAIKPGERYVRVAMLFDGSWSTEAACAACDDAIELFGKVPGHPHRTSPSLFPEILRDCVNEGDADSTMVALLDQLRRRGSRPVRGYTTWELAAALAVTMAVALTCFVAVSAAVDDRDRAIAERDDEAARADRCADEWGKTVARASLLRAELAEHLAAEDENACACWIAGQP